jgi:hypothetical protein
VVGGGGEDVITRGVQGEAGHRTLVHRQHLGEDSIKKGQGHEIAFENTDKLRVLGIDKNLLVHLLNL